MTAAAIVMIVILSAVLVLWFVRFFAEDKRRKNSVRAKIIRHRRISHKETGENGKTFYRESLFLIFETEKGTQFALSANRKIFADAPENKWGMLYYKGNRLLSFEFDDRDGSGL